MDTRAFRLDLPTGLTTFEIDRPELLEVKDSRLAGAAARPRCRRIAVGADLAGEWADDLAGASFRPGAPAMFLAERLLAYFEEAGMHRLLETLGQLAATGSYLVVAQRR